MRYLVVFLIIYQFVYADNNTTLPIINFGIKELKQKEGNVGRTIFRFPIYLDKPSTKDITLKYRISHGFFISDKDFNPSLNSGKNFYVDKILTIKVGSTKAFIDVGIVGDRVFESDESFYVSLLEANNAYIGKNSNAYGVVLNDDIIKAGMDFDAHLSEYEAKRGLKMTFYANFAVDGSKVNATISPDKKITVYYHTEDDSAKDGEDYIGVKNGKIVLDGSTNKPIGLAGMVAIEIPIKDDNKYEPEERFKLVIDRVLLEQRMPDGTKKYKNITVFPGGGIKYGIIHDDDLPNFAGDSYTISDVDSVDNITIKTKIVNKPSTLRIKASSSFGGVYTIRETYQCNTCGGCTLIKTEKGGSFIRNRKERYASNKKTTKNIKNPLELASGGGVACSVYTKYVLKGLNKDMHVDVVDLYTFSDSECKVQITTLENPIDLLSTKYNLNNIKEHTIHIDAGKFFDLKFKIPYAFKCGKIIVRGHSAKDYTQKYIKFQYKARDNFATRPDKFIIKNNDFPYSLKNPLVAGKKVIFPVYALDKDGIKTINYNQFLKTQQNLLFLTDQLSKSPNKSKYVYNKNNDGFNINGYFKNGEFRVDTSYDEVGEIELNISETKKDLFAKVDENDSGITKQDLYIQPFIKVFKVIPDHFEIFYTNHNYLDNNEELNLIANDLSQMYSYIDINIKAVNKKGKVTKKYENGGYAYNTNLVVTRHIQTNPTSKIYTLLHKISNNYNILRKDNISKYGKALTLSYNILNSEFIQGQVQEKIYTNFARAKNKPLNPIKLYTDKLYLIETNGVKNHLVDGENKNRTYKDFYYARIYAPSPQLTSKNFLNAKIYYEVYCKNCDKRKFKNAKNKASIDSVYWYILPKDIFEVLDDKTKNDFTCDYTFLRFYKKSLIDSYQKKSRTIFTIWPKKEKIPFKNRVYYKPIKEFLLFDFIDPNVKEQFFDIGFSSGAAKWAGEGNLGNTIDLKINDSEVKSFEW